MPNSPAGKQREGLGDGATDDVLERLSAALPHVDDLLIDVPQAVIALSS